MPSNDLAAAVERLLSPTQPDEYWEPDYEYGEPDHHTAEKDLPMVAQACRAYLARESDDAKPVDREWLVSVLGREPDSYENYIEYWESQHGGGCFTWAPGDCCRWCRDFAEFELEARGDVRAMVRLARWPTNENGGK